MAQETFIDNFSVDTPATYRIRVKGRLDSRWADILYNMRIIPDPSITNNQATMLVGQLPDQTALSGVLNALYDRHVPVLSF